ncbi:hypothetical protein TrST_g571 [Triparma strigata]|uniref:Calpain catalytic domain-containing protein n=1 Tax=Triparma strigata TaxID=1606541 RepID=A0A9W7ER58_9STRA|nr:hypothetical protein TrST_g571 [Triparma strigata]
MERLALERVFSFYSNDSDGGTLAMDKHDLPDLLSDLGLTTLDKSELKLALSTFSSLNGDDDSPSLTFSDFYSWWLTLADAAKANPSNRMNINNNDDNDNNTVIKQLGENVTMYIYTESIPNHDRALTRHKFSIYASRLNAVDLTVDFSSSTNLILTMKNSSARLSSTDVDSLLLEGIQPFRMVDVMELTVEDNYLDWRLIYEIKYRLSPPPSEDRDLEMYFKKIKDEGMKLIEEDLRGFGGEDYLDSQGHRHGFVDVEFLPQDISVCSKREASEEEIGGGYEYSETGTGMSCHDARVVAWRRSEDFLVRTNTHLLFGGGVDPRDICKGVLADEWLLGALAGVAEREDLVNEMVRKVKKGVYECQIFNGGRRHTMLLDDYFPCFPEAGPVFSRNRGGNLWVSLVEKAFAKIFGSYFALRGGATCEGLLDLTGCPTRLYSLRSGPVMERIRNGKFWTDDLMGNLKRGCIVCCESGAKENAKLRPGHSYTVLHTVEVGNIQLLKIRNPWGGEWNGDWSLQLGGWTDRMKRAVSKILGCALDEVASEGDGCFWMSYTEFVENFVSVSVCEVTSASGNSWKVCTECVTFERGVGSAGGDVGKRKEKGKGDNLDELYPLRSEVFTMNVTKRGEVVLSLHNRDLRMKHSGENAYPAVGFTVLRKDASTTSGRPNVMGVGGYSLVAHVGLCRERQLQTKSLVLDAGSYIIVPYTCEKVNDGGFDVGDEDEDEGEMGGEERQLREESHRESIRMAAREIFDRFDQDNDGHLNHKEFPCLVDRAVGRENVGNATLRNEVRSKLGMEGDDGLGVTRKALVDACVDDGARGGVVESLLKECGYVCGGWGEEGGGSGWRLKNQLCVNLCVWSEHDCKVVRTGFNGLAFKDALDLPVRLRGEVQHAAEFGIKVFTLVSGRNGVTIGVQNVKRNDVWVRMDTSESRNCVSHREDMVHDAKVKSGEMVVMHHLTPVRGADWEWTYRKEMKE